MPTHRYRSGLGYQPAFTTAGHAWITDSSLQPSGSVTVQFPTVAKSITIVNNVAENGMHSTVNTGSLVVHFGPPPSAETLADNYYGVYHWSTKWNGVNIPQIKNNHYVELADPNDSFTFDVKCSTVNITCLGFNDSPTSAQATGVSGSFLLFAELTSVDSDEMFTMTGSGITDET